MAKYPASRKKALSSLISLSKHKNAAVRRIVLHGLFTYGPVVLPHVAAMLVDKAPGVRKKVKRYLQYWAVRKFQGQMLTYLIGVLKKPKVSYKAELCQLLGNMKQGAKKALPLLQRHLKHKDIKVRKAAKAAIDAIR